MLLKKILNTSNTR